MQIPAIAAAVATLAPGFATADAPAAPGDPNAEVPSEELRAWIPNARSGRAVLRPRRRLRSSHPHERGVHERAQIAFFYAESRQKLDVIDAYTETPDAGGSGTGRQDTHPGEPGHGRCTHVRRHQGDDHHIPRVEVHSKLHLPDAARGEGAVVPRLFHFSDTVDPHGLDDDDRITVYAAPVRPSDRRGRLPGRCMACPADEKAENATPGRLAHGVRAARGGFSQPADYGQHVIISNFPSYEAIAKAYWDRAADKVRVTSEIQALADQLAQGMGDPRGEAEGSLQTG